MNRHPFIWLLLALWLGAADAHGDVALTTMVSFNGTNGSCPMAALVEGVDGNFYGTTKYGGTTDGGTVFKMTSSGKLTILAGFYGGTNGYWPMAALVQRKYDSSLYGTTSGIGGPKGACGTVFRITTNGTFTTLVSFNGGSGAQPMGALVEGADGNFYGTTQYGSYYTPLGYGTVFKMTFNGWFSSLRSFYAPDGAYPCAALVQGEDGQFYGTTEEGGPNNAGTVFKIGSGGSSSTLYSFAGADDGFYPLGALVQGAVGSFYGTTEYGGTNDVERGGDGTIFRLTTNGIFTTLASFNVTNGANPIAGLIQGRDGNFYGTTCYGGAAGGGTLFRMTPAGALTTLHSFGGDDGWCPAAALVQGSDGNLYGTAQYGGTDNCGTIFRFSIQPVLQAMVKTGAGLSLTWNAVSGRTYQVQYKTNWNQAKWADFGTTMTATNGTLTTCDPTASSQRWYRVALLP
jgi:uncharacterized repeat protein (TIGR03803 family)